jgi:exodeoxyribonuclease-3
MSQPSFTIATWNVNSINARLQHLLRWLRESGTDIVLLQETKVVDEAFPALEIEDLGYNILFHGQKTYNGVAILSKYPLEEVQRGLPGMVEDTQARYLEAIISLPGSAIRTATVYVPNGESPQSEKWPYKMRFYDALSAHAATWQDLDEAVILGGDYNCAPLPTDVYDPVRLDGTTCYHPAEREKLRTLMHSQRLHDAFRLLYPNKADAYSWWDYRAGAFPQNKGFRIDHLLVNAQAADLMSDCWIDTDPRHWEKPSDHTPVVGRFSIPRA